MTLARTLPGKVGSYPVEVAVDNGPAKYANGAVTLNSQGTPIAYNVAPDDLVDAVANRFGFFDPSAQHPFKAGLDYLIAINQVRRGSNMTLYVGDTLNLSADTIATVGDINGTVQNNPPPSEDRPRP